MKASDFTRPDKLLLSGIKSLSSLTNVLYSTEKSTAKGKSEVAFIGKRRLDKVENQLYTYDKHSADYQEEISEFDFIDQAKKGKNYWLNFHGIHEVSTVSNIGKLLGLDRLTVRQILDTTQRPKVLLSDQLLFISVKSILKEDYGELDVEQISFILGPHFVISFQEEKGDHFETIRSRMLEGIGFIRSFNCDYLLFQLLDAILDNYFETIEKINQEIASLEKILLSEVNPHKTMLLTIETEKRSAQLIKKSLTPFKEALLNVTNKDTPLIQKESLKYFMDLTNSVVSAIEEAESTVRTLEGLTNIYFSALSQKMNEIMKVLTTVATIFIPMTFIAGIYGMNFNYMPELQYKYGYFAVWGVMLVVFALMMVYFKRKRWL